MLIVTDSYRPLIGGANRSIELLAQHMSSLGHRVAVATAWQPGVPTLEDDPASGVRVHRVRDLTSRVPWISEDPYKHNPPPFPDPEATWRLRRLIRDFQPDLVHAYGWLTHSTAAAMLGMKIPLLVSARDYGNICAVRTLIRNDRICDGPAPAKCLACAASTYGLAKGSVAAVSVAAARPLLRRKTTAVHCASRFVARTMDRHLRVPNAHSVVIPNFHEEGLDYPVDDETLARLPRQRFILFVGAFRKVKGIQELFVAYERLSDPPPLVLVGTLAPDSPESFPAGAIVLTDVPHPTVMAIWERALFGVSPSRVAETFGNVVLEAMSKGRAVIGTRPGGHEDMIDDGDTGLLVPAGDADALAEAMGRLLDDPPLREQIGRRARERARLFSPEVIMPQLERLYRVTVARSHETQP